MTVVGDEGEFEALLDYLKRSRGCDLTAYKRPSVTRRLQKRMHLVGVESYGQYLEYLQVHPEEFTSLFDALLINYTGFFRDRDSWNYLATEIVPRILADKESDEPIRIWSAACATGEEACSLAVVLAEALGIEQFLQRVKIYATDVDEAALKQARRAEFSSTAVTGIPDELLKKYFEPSEQGYSFRRQLRRTIVFGRHDLVQDAPMSRIDLLVCRNALMYFTVKGQGKILVRFHFALNDRGFLFLGNAETLYSHNQIFTSVDLKHNFFAKKPGLGREELLLLQNGSKKAAVEATNRAEICEAVFEASPVAQIVLDLKGLLVAANTKAREIFGITPKDLKRPWKYLQLFYRLKGLHSCIEQLYASNCPFGLKDVEWTTPNGTIYLDVQVAFVADSLRRVLGTSLTFTDVTQDKILQNKLKYCQAKLAIITEKLDCPREGVKLSLEVGQFQIDRCAE